MLIEPATNVSVPLLVVITTRSNAPDNGTVVLKPANPVLVEELKVPEPVQIFPVEFNNEKTA